MGYEDGANLRCVRHQRGFSANAKKPRGRYLPRFAEKGDCDFIGFFQVDPSVHIIHGWVRNVAHASTLTMYTMGPGATWAKFAICANSAPGIRARSINIFNHLGFLSGWARAGARMGLTWGKNGVSLPHGQEIHHDENNFVEPKTPQANSGCNGRTAIQGYGENYHSGGKK